MHKSADIRKD